MAIGGGRGHGYRGRTGPVVVSLPRDNRISGGQVTAGISMALALPGQAQSRQRRVRAWLGPAGRSASAGC